MPLTKHPATMPPKPARNPHAQRHGVDASVMRNDKYQACMGRLKPASVRCIRFRRSSSCHNCRCMACVNVPFLAFFGISY